MNKSVLIQHLKTLLDERMKAAWTAMEAAQQSANEQGKSSMGDKYETSRSMGQLDRDMFAKQYETARQERLVLERISETEVPARSAVGTLLDTTAGKFMIAVSIGKISIEGETVVAISPSSPVGAVMLGKVSGDTFAFMGKEHRILGIS